MSIEITSKRMNTVWNMHSMVFTPILSTQCSLHQVIFAWTCQVDTWSNTQITWVEWFSLFFLFFFHLQNIAQLAHWKAILAWLVSTATSQHCLRQVGWVVTGVSVAKYSFASLKRENLWHVENKICSSGYYPLAFFFAIISSLIVRACVYVRLRLQCVT